MSNIDRINIGKPNLDQSYAIHGKDQVRTGKTVHSSSAKNDSVELSPEAMEIDRISSLVTQSRQERVDQVRQMISDGTYSVSSTEIARKLIESNRK